MLISVFNITHLYCQIDPCKDERDTYFKSFEIEKFKTFAKAYGYVKYFHPSDEASQIDWDRFAVYGAKKVRRCKTKKELITTLEELFHPVAPSIKFYHKKEDIHPYKMEDITPVDTSDYKETYWQHQGISLNMNSYSREMYNSIRVNARHFRNDAATVGNLLMEINVEHILGEKIKFKSLVKADYNLSPSVTSWLRFYGKNNKILKTKSHGLRIDKIPQWQEIEIIEKIPVHAETVRIGTYLYGKGKAYIDSFSLFIEKNGKWIPMDLEKFNLDKDIPFASADKSILHGTGLGYDFKIEHGIHNKKRVATIEYSGHQTVIDSDTIFSFKPSFGEIIRKDIGQGIQCQIPLNLYIHPELGTFPKPDSLKNHLIDEAIRNEKASVFDESFRVGNVINFYNVFQHFYPYFDEINVDWDKAFNQALSKSIKDQNMDDHIATLKIFGTSLNDGHFKVYRIGDNGNYGPPILWEWVENKLVITKVIRKIKGLKRGDIVTHVNGISTIDYFNKVYKNISSATKGYLEEQAEYSSLYGERNSEIKITVAEKNFILIRDELYRAKYQIPNKNDTLARYKEISKDVFYINLTKLGMSEIEELLPKLKETKAIICDVRGRPNRNTDFLSYFLKEDDTTKVWLKVPRIIYPDNENVSGYEDFNWSLKAKSPYLGDKKNIFITDARAISYAESYLGYVKAYKLGLILGETTAGTNGNVNPFNLLGGINIRWTGMKVINHDGSQFHGVGIVPDIPTRRTIKGIREGKDELLDRALEIAASKP